MADFWNKISKKYPNGFSCLAPMEGVTDDLFRQVILRAARPDLFWTEFTNVSSFANQKGRASAIKRFQHKRNQNPILAQIWGTEPEDFAFTAKHLHKLGFSAIDINMGCPDKNVVKTGGGSGLIRTPDLAVEIIKAVQTAGLPVSVKTRLGFSSLDEKEGWIKTLLEQDLAALTVHLRTRKEASKVPAHHELIPWLIELRNRIAPQTLLIINGDIKNYQDGMEMIKNHPGLSGFMIGRGVFGNPFCFEKLQRPHTQKELLSLLKLHLKLFEQASEEDRRPFESLKHFFKIYVRDFPGASELRVKLMECHSVDEASRLL